MIVSTVGAWPDRWPRWPHLRVYCYLVCGALLAALWVFALTIFVADPSPAFAAFQVVIGGALIGCLVHGVQFFLHPYFRRRSTVELVEQALVIRYRSARVSVAMFGGTYMAAGGLMIIGVGLRLDDAVTVVFGGMPTALGAIVGVLAVNARRGRYHLGLTPHEVQWRTTQRTVSVSWDIVAGIDPEHVLEYEWPGGSPHQGLNVRVRLQRFRVAGSGKDPEDDILVPAGQLSAAPALTFWVLDHYFRHPAQRHELGTEAAIERIRRGPSEP